MVALSDFRVLQWDAVPAGRLFQHRLAGGAESRLGGETEALKRVPGAGHRAFGDFRAQHRQCSSMPAAAIGAQPGWSSPSPHTTSAQLAVSLVKVGAGFGTIAPAWSCGLPFRSTFEGQLRRSRLRRVVGGQLCSQLGITYHV